MEAMDRRGDKHRTTQVAGTARPNRSAAAATTIEFGGKVVHARVQKVGEPTVTEERSWGAHERVTVRRR